MHTSERIDMPSDVRLMLENVATAMLEDIAPSEVVLILLPAGDGRCEVVVGAAAESPAAVADQIVVDPREDAFAREIIATGKAVRNAGASGEPRMPKAIAERFSAQSLVGLSIRHGGELLGLIYLLNPTSAIARSGYGERAVLAYVDMVASALAHALRRDRLEQVYQRQGTTLQALSQGVYWVNAAGEITYCNQAAAQFVGYRLDEVVGRYEQEVFPQSTVHVAEKAGLPMCEVMYRRDGSLMMVEISRSPLEKRGADAGSAVAFFDITAQKKLETQVEYQLYYDTLTGLPNRLMFSRHLQGLLNQAQADGVEMCPFALLLIDVNEFQATNDTLGRDSADVLLQKVSIRLKEFLGQRNFLARFNDREFAIILRNVVSDREVNERAREILQELLRPLTIDKCEWRVKPSIGASLFPRDAKDGATLLNHADRALSRCKARATGHFVLYNPRLKRAPSTRRGMAENLDDALLHNQFVLHYQPQIDLRSGRILGMEALIRWFHPKHGLISPATFIPVAEQTGLIVPLGDWILRTACEQGKVWHQVIGAPIRLSVNLSAKQLLSKSFVQTVDSIVQDSGFDPRYLELELTESTIFQSTGSVKSTMHHLKELGARLSIDDFGTGYSSLGYLKDFPIDTLKIDQTFIRDMPRNKKNVKITSAVIALARSLGLVSVAEGVETQRQAEFLQVHECDQAQGYFYFKPMPGQDASRLLGELKHTPSEHLGTK